MNDIILKLEQLGFSPYEAKAYYALVRKRPANGYEISKIAKIPAAKVYETISRLKIKGAIIESSTELGKFYPVPPETLLGKVKQDFTTIIEELETQLKQTEPLPDIELTLNLSGYEVLIEKMLGIINMANITLFISIWPDEAVLLDSAIANAVGRGVNVITEVFGNYQLSGDSINLKNCGESSQARLGKRLSVVVRDAEEVIIGEISEDGEAEGIWTTTPGIVLIAKEYIKHDIWGNILIDALGQSQFKQLCEENELLSYLIKNR